MNQKTGFSFRAEYFLQHGKNLRIGVLNTPHGPINTPAFVFCATKGAIKGLTMEDMVREETQVILGNTYHLMLSPGADVVETLDGLAKMSGWAGPTLTDSGGYQIFSMGHGSVAEEIKGNRKNAIARSSVKISEDGAVFKSYIDGKTVVLTPEASIEQQKKIGADLIVAFDECTPYHIDRDYTAYSMERSHRWEKRSLLHFAAISRGADSASCFPPQLPAACASQAMYGIAQGGVYEDLRRESCDFLNGEAFFGHAIGGCLGATKEQMHSIVGFTANLLRKDRPIHLLGIGKIEDIFNGVEFGIDTFDCVHPTRIARHGCALIKPAEYAFISAQLGPQYNSLHQEHINLRNHVFVGDENPIEKDCSCQTCKKYSRGYINYLLRAKEILSHTLITRHNVHFMNSMMAEIRAGITHQNFYEVKRKWCCV
ncbi:MAG: tRNA guanosine(34) transglycosylase Tgt [Holosporales bacterium]|nr:tRNA guanosine(34) transglycosylase Tgt [Holosporales bacterium]